MTPLPTHTGFPWVMVVGLLPLLGVLGILVLPRAREIEARTIALGASLLTFAASIAMAIDYKVHGAPFQFTQDYSWIKAFGAHYAVGADGIALALILMTTALTPICVLASWHDADRPAPGPDGHDGASAGRGPRLFFTLMLATETLVIGGFGSLDVFFFYVLFEAMLIPMYFLIGSFGGPRRSYAAVKFLLYSLVGGLLMLVAVIALYVTSAHQLGHGTFDYRVLVSQVHISHNEQIALFLGFFIAFAIKAPLWPFHTWLPDAASEAPTGTAVMLVGILDKVGTFGFLRFCIPLFPDASKVFAPYILGLCVMGILYGALAAIGQKDLKRLIETRRKGGIFLSVLGFGRGNYNDGLMQALAQNGNGTAAYIDTLAEAQKTLVEEAGASLFPIAKDVKFEMEFNPARIAEYRLIGYETRVLNREDFNNDKVDAGDVGAGTTVTALYEITPKGSGGELVDPLRYGNSEAQQSSGSGDELAFLKLRYKLPGETASKLMETPVTQSLAVDDIAKASDDMRFAAAVAAFGQSLKDSAYGTMPFAEIAALARGARGPDPEGYRSEFVQLAETAGALKGGK